MSTGEHRLPTDLKPLHYDLTIKTDLQDLKFSGQVEVELVVETDTSNVIFNASNLNIYNLWVIPEGSDQRLVPVSVSHDPTSERTSLALPSSLKSGSKAKLHAEFDAKLTGDMMGYYRASWKQEGKEAFYSLTQFEATAARRSFPCWDEPLFKATYSIKLISRTDTVSLSNMPAITEEPYTTDPSLTGDWKITAFEITPPVSSYLIAYANGPFEFLETTFTSSLSGRTIPLRIYATPDCIHQAQFALDVKAKVLPLYEELFDIAFPLPKLDTLVATDFDAGAMENWGLITGRTSMFLMDPKKVGVAIQKRVATTQSHEVAHMWFGNITTMAWWDNLYLNEGFATLMGEVIVIDKIFPEWKTYSEFITSNLNDALNLDAKLSSHPIEVECPDANQIDQIFDSLSYAKAASIFRMLSAYVGEEKFLKGVSIYLKKRLYANSVTKDLWDGISEATGLDVATMMTNWVSKIGFPVLTVTESPNGITVRQDRFLETGPAPEEENTTLWHIPLNLLTEDADGKIQIDRSLVLAEREITIPLDTSKPFKLNAGHTGVYRVLYEPQRLSKIASEAAHSEKIFSFDDRIGLVHDTFAITKAGFAPVSDALNLVQLFSNEKEFLVWDGVQEKLGNLLAIWWEDEKIAPLLKIFLRNLYGSLADRLGFDGSSEDSADIKQLRTLALRGAAGRDYPPVVQELQKRFDTYMKTGDNSGIPLDIERIAFTTAVRLGGRTEYDFMKKVYHNPPTPSTKTAAIAGMCSTKDQTLIDETFDFIFKEAKNEDIPTFFTLLAGSNARRQNVEFIKKNWDEVYERFAANTSLNRIIRNSFQALSTEKDIEETEKFFKDKDVSKFNLALAQALDTIRAKVAVIKRSSDDVYQWLDKSQHISKI